MTARKPYAPRKHPGVAPRLRQFFADNPGEELTIVDMMLKFDCSNGSARQAIKMVGQAVPLECVRVYRRKAVS